MELTTRLQDSTKGLFPELIGVEFAEASADGIRATLHVRDALCTTPGVLHGGAIMGFADTLGAYGAFLCLEPGARTTTIESKTNFFAAGRAGTTITGHATPLHRGRTTMVWQTRVTGEGDRLLALVTQTQAVLARRPSAEEQLSGLFAGLDVESQQALFARLERQGALLYRAWAEAETDPGRRDALLGAAAREEDNAETLEDFGTGSS